LAASAPARATAAVPRPHPRHQLLRAARRRPVKCGPPSALRHQPSPQSPPQPQHRPLPRGGS
jgi:hypothetical protein